MIITINTYSNLHLKDVNMSFEDIFHYRIKISSGKILHRNTSVEQLIQAHREVQH